MISPVSDSLLTPIAVSAAAITIGALTALTCRVGDCLRRVTTQTPQPVAPPMVWPQAPERPPSPAARAADDDAVPEDIRQWQHIAEKLEENDDPQAPARKILAIINPDNAEDNVNIDEIVNLLKAMYEQNNYGGLSKLLDTLKKNSDGPIFEALQKVCQESIEFEKDCQRDAAIRLSQLMGIGGETSKFVVDNIRHDRIEAREHLPHEVILILLAKAVKENDSEAINIICNAVFFEETKLLTSVGRHYSASLMMDCLNLVLYDESKNDIAKTMVAIFTDSATQKTNRSYFGGMNFTGLFYSSTFEFPIIFIEKLHPILEQLSVSVIKSAGKKDPYDQQKT